MSCHGEPTAACHILPVEDPSLLTDSRGSFLSWKSKRKRAHICNVFAAAGLAVECMRSMSPFQKGRDIIQGECETNECFISVTTDSSADQIVLFF